MARPSAAIPAGGLGIEGLPIEITQILRYNKSAARRFYFLYLLLGGLSGIIKLMTICRICYKRFSVISNTHLRLHGLSIREYIKKYGSAGVGFSVTVADLPPKDPRYRRWRESLKKRPPPWSKGYTKETHPSVAKISRTFKKRRIDNFKEWRQEAKERGIIRYEWPPFRKDGDLAELLGMILGDGHIAKFPRTECLIISSNSEDVYLIQRYAGFMEKFLNKKPYIEVPKGIKKCTRIRIYQKDISRRLGVPTGNRGKVNNTVPAWILRNRNFMIRFLRGLYEAEGSFCVHKPTYTYKLLFSNRNPSLLNVVYDGLKKLGFHPHRSEYKIQLSKKDEVYRCKELLQFRKY